MIRVDAHSHLMPTALFDALPDGLRAHRAEDEIALEVAARDGALGRGAVARLRELDVHRAQQAAHGIDLTIVGPWIDMIAAPTDAVTQTALCRAVNAALGAVTAGVEHTRFVAALPDLDGGAAADVLAQALEQGAVGGMLSTTGVARPELDALWSAAERARAPITLHPGEFRPPPRLREYFMVNLVGNPSETTLAAGSLLGADVPGRFGDLQVMLVHGGGFLPYQHGRMRTGFARWPTLKRELPEDVLRWFTYDTVLFDDDATRHLLDVVGPDRVVAGSDSPFAMSDFRPYDAPDFDPDVLGANALRLFQLDLKEASPWPNAQ